MISFAAIIQARIGSTRLAGKVMRPLCGKTVLAQLITRLQRVDGLSHIIIATSDKPHDDVIAHEAHACGVHAVRGSEENVLSRYALAARTYPTDALIRITSDCPLYDPDLLAHMMSAFITSPCDYLSNCITRSYPRGLDTEIMTTAALIAADTHATSQTEREHVTPYIYRNPEQFHIQNYTQKNDDSHHRWTLDTQEDWALIEHIYNALYPANPHFSTADVLAYLAQHPEVVGLNAHIEQKKTESL